MGESRSDAPGGISARSLHKRFGDVAALDGVDLEVAPGEVVVLLGRNGAGKSTLIRVLATTILADSGRATIAGHDVETDAVAARRRTGFVLGDERSWYWRLTGRANLEFFAVLYGMHRDDGRLRSAALLELLGLTDAADRRFDGYSSGMRARLSLARALLLEPPVLLLDEPSRTLDPAIAADLRDLITRTARDDGRAVLWVTHDLHEASLMADRILIQHDGRMVDEVQPPCTSAELERRFLAQVDP